MTTERTMQERQVKHNALLDLRYALDTARRLYHDSTRWNEGEEYTPDGQSCDEWIDERFLDVQDALDRLEASLREAAAALDLTANWLADESGLNVTATVQGIRNDARKARATLTQSES